MSTVSCQIESRSSFVCLNNELFLVIAEPTNNKTIRVYNRTMYAANIWCIVCLYRAKKRNHFIGAIDNKILTECVFVYTLLFTEYTFLLFSNFYI